MATKQTKSDGIYPTEAEIQVMFIKFIRFKYPNILVHHSPNEGKRTNGYVLSQLGMSKGFPDLFFPEPRGKYHGLFIEMKRDKAAHPTVSSEQKIWIQALRNRDYKAEICYGYDEAVKVLTDYMEKGV